MRPALALVALLLAGCASPPPLAPVHGVDDGAEDDGLEVLATRVEPLVHAVDLAGRIEGRPCARTSATDPCRMGTWGTSGTYGMTWDEPAMDFGDAEALFWRVDVTATSRSLTPGAGLHMLLFALEPCAGDGCFSERAVAERHGPGEISFNHMDVFLQPGETGLRLRLAPLGEHPEAGLGAAGTEYEVQGWVAGFRAVGEPVVVG